MNTINFTTKDHLIHDLKAPIQRLQSLSQQSSLPISDSLRQCTQYLEDIVKTYFGVSFKNHNHSIRNLIGHKVNLFEKVEFTTQYKASIDHINFLNIDSFKLNRILYNIINNSYEALTKTQVAVPQITIKTHNTNKDFYITISDNGCGFPPHILNGIAKNSSHESRGIGLHAVHTILNESAGQMSLSNDRNGAHVTLRIPLIFKNFSEVAIFDDDILTSRYMEKELKKSRLKVLTNPNVKDVSHKTLIFMDVNLGQECGIEKAKDIKKMKKTDIFLVTNHTHKDLEKLSFISGVINKSDFSL